MAVVWSRVPWSTSTPYLIGARVTNGAVVVGGFTFPCVYECVVPGNSAGAGPGPVGTADGVPIADGAVTWAYKGPFGGEVVGLGGKLAAIPAAVAATLLDIVDTTVSEEYFGGQSDAARMYLAAHFATLALQRGLNAITSETVGPLTRAYSMAPKLDGHLALTAYGAVFAEMRAATGAGLGFTA